MLKVEQKRETSFERLYSKEPFFKESFMWHGKMLCVTKSSRLPTCRVRRQFCSVHSIYPAVRQITAHAAPLPGDLQPTCGLIVALAGPRIWPDLHSELLLCFLLPVFWQNVEQKETTGCQNRLAYLAVLCRASNLKPAAGFPRRISAVLGEFFLVQAGSGAGYCHGSPPPEIILEVELNRSIWWDM